jgi:MSHA biogenesis protein MshJ
MDALKQRWLAWSMRIDALSFRERILVFLAVAGVALSLVFVGLIEPALKQQEQMLVNASGLQQEIFTLREQLTQSEQLNQSGLNTELGRLRAEAATLEQQVRARESGLIPPDKMIAAIKTLLTAQPGLTLVALQTAPPRQALDEAAAETGGAPEQQPSGQAPPTEKFYKHGVTVRVQGSYAQLADYVARLESLPWTVQWQSVKLDARQHPRLELTLELNTLSRESTWARL